ncbi:MAG: TolC family protein [Vicinamibacterales bacterium]
MASRVLFVTVFLCAASVESFAQTRQVLTLEEALRLAGATSENVAIAEAAVARATGDRLRARSLTRPQLAGSASYDRALASEFSGLFDSAGPPCPPLDIDATRPLADRVAEIERALDCGAVGGFSFGGDDEDGGLPFGRKNTWRANLTFTQGLYSGGRVGAARALAHAAFTGADAGLTAAKAQLALDVTRAYYDAALADRLVTIAEASYTQANALFEQARTMFEAGSRPEFELLRAQVARDNQQPAVIRARSQRDIAYLRLKQLLDLPATATLRLEAGLSETALPPPAPFHAALVAAGDPALAAAAASDLARSAVRQAEASVAVSEASVALARAQKLPIISVVSNLGEVAYPGGLFPTDWRTNWTVGAAMSVPILTGGRQRADDMVAQADLATARARLQQTRELTALDTETARQELIAADAAWTASAGTVTQARRAYEIAELRYREGISTQLELADARLALEAAEANRAQAARDVQVARARVALLPNLPLSQGR